VQETEERNGPWEKPSCLGHQTPSPLIEVGFLLSIHHSAPAMQLRPFSEEGGRWQSFPPPLWKVTDQGQSLYVLFW
jgi:hypothetical protein